MNNVYVSNTTRLNNSSIINPTHGYYQFSQLNYGCYLIASIKSPSWTQYHSPRPNLSSRVSQGNATLPCSNKKKCPREEGSNKKSFATSKLEVRTPVLFRKPNRRDRVTPAMRQIAPRGGWSRIDVAVFDNCGQWCLLRFFIIRLYNSH